MGVHFAPRYNAGVLAHAADFLTLTDDLADRRHAEGAELEARAAARRGIADPMTREIARHLGAGEARDAHVANLALLSALVSAHPDGVPLAGASERVQAAFDRVRAQGNYSSVEALQRELDRDRDDELHALLLLMVN